MSGIPDDAVYETWDSMLEQSVALGEMIQQHCQQTGERFDAIVAVPRGSYYPVNIIARQLGFNSVGLLHACIGSYEADSSQRQQQFTLGQMPTDAEVQGKQLLIIEEVCDTGHTLAFLTQRLQDQGAAMVRTGVLHHKPTRNQTNFQPDWFVQETDAWIVYPWEQFETNPDSRF